MFKSASNRNENGRKKAAVTASNSFEQKTTIRLKFLFSKLEKKRNQMYTMSKAMANRKLTKTRIKHSKHLKKQIKNTNHSEQRQNKPL